MTGPFANRLFRIAFAAAGIYNLAFGLWAAVWPLAFFNLFEIPLPRYPGIWACLGMVVGVYGLLYLHAAWKLETAWPIIAVGLIGKVLGPVGMAMSFDDDWPRRLGMLCVYNDLIWWLPFGLFLVRGTPLAKWLEKLVPWLCIVVHIIALVMTWFILWPGLQSEPDPAARAAHIAAHATSWTLGWTAWMLSAASLVGFYAWWGSRLSNFPSPLRGGASREFQLATIAVLITAIGMVCDLSGESLLVLPLVEVARLQTTPEHFTSIERAFVLLSAGAANGLYTLGGILLTLATPNLPRWIRAAMWLTWLAGAAMTLAAIMNHVGAMAVSTIVLFPAFIVWVTWMAARWPTEMRRMTDNGRRATNDE